MKESITIYHGTSAKNAKQIQKQGFIPDKKYNWEVTSKKGFVYLSLAYALFYAMNAGTTKLALIKVQIEKKHCYPEDDFLMMYGLNKQKYSQEELTQVDLETNQTLWEKSLQYMGNIAAKPKDIQIIGMRVFNSKNLILKCDPTISPINFRLMGNYYIELSDWIYEGNNLLDFPKRW